MVGAKRRLFRIPPAEFRIQKGFPRSAWLKKYGSILNLKVRTDFFEQMKFFFICSVVCQFHIVFQKLFCKFEPIIRFLLKSPQFLFEKLILINQLVFSFAIFFKRQRTFEIGTHQLLYFGIQKRNIGFYTIRKKRTRLNLRLPIFCIFGNHPFCPIERQRNFFDFLLNLRSDELLADIFLSTRIFPFSTSQIVMTFLCFGSDKTATFSATEKSAVNVRFQTLAMWFRFSAHHFGNGIKKFL